MSYGIRVKNPLTKPVKVQVWEGKKIVRDVMVDPQHTKFIALDHPGEYEVRPMIVDNVFSGSYDELGPAAVRVTAHEDIAPEEMKPVSLSKTIETNGGYWKTVVRWDIPRGGRGELMSVEIEKFDGVDWRLKMGHWLDARRPQGKTTPISQSTTFSQCLLGGGEAVILQARSRGMKTIVSGRVSGKQTITDGTKLLGMAQQPSDDEEVTVRSLSDMFKELEEQEVRA